MEVPTIRDETLPDLINKCINPRQRSRGRVVFGGLSSQTRFYLGIPGAQPIISIIAHATPPTRLSALGTKDYAGFSASFEDWPTSRKAAS